MKYHTAVPIAIVAMVDMTTVTLKALSSLSLVPGRRVCMNAGIDSATDARIQVPSMMAAIVSFSVMRNLRKKCDLSGSAPPKPLHATVARKISVVNSHIV